MHKRIVQRKDSLTCMGKRIFQHGVSLTGVAENLSAIDPTKPLYIFGFESCNADAKEALHLCCAKLGYPAVDVDRALVEVYADGESLYNVVLQNGADDDGITIAYDVKLRCNDRNALVQDILRCFDKMAVSLKVIERMPTQDSLRLHKGYFREIDAKTSLRFATVSKEMFDSIVQDAEQSKDKMICLDKDLVAVRTGNETVLFSTVAMCLPMDCDGFFASTSFTEIDLTGVYFPIRVYASRMFYNCRNLRSVQFDANSYEPAVYMATGDSMFEGCHRLQAVDMVGFAPEFCNAQFMFADCYALKDLKLPKMPVPIHHGPMVYIFTQGMFRNCRSLECLDMEWLPTLYGASMPEMFAGCESLVALDFSPCATFAPDEVTRTFYGCVSLQKINFGHTENRFITEGTEMFYNCRSLKELDLSWIDNSDTMDCDYSGMFMGCSALETVNLSRMELSGKGLVAYDMFRGCKSLKNIITGEGFTINQKECKTIRGMFRDCPADVVKDICGDSTAFEE